MGIVEAIERDNASALMVGDTIAKIDLRYFRPSEVETLLDDQSKAKLGWLPQITTQEMHEEMLAANMGSGKLSTLSKKNTFNVAVSAER